MKIDNNCVYASSEVSRIHSQSGLITAVLAAGVPGNDTGSILRTETGRYRQIST